MIIERTSPFDGKKRQMDLPITEEEMEAWYDGEVAQRAFPDLSADQREFIQTGLTSDNWESIFPKLPSFSDLKFNLVEGYPHEQLGELPKMQALWECAGLTVSVCYGGSNYGDGPGSDQYEVAVFVGTELVSPLKYIRLSEHDDVLGWVSADNITRLMEEIKANPGGALEGSLQEFVKELE
jgi:hypothetical protein